MSYVFKDVPIYGIDGLTGRRIQISQHDKIFNDYSPLGGKLYYLDPNSDRKVTFMLSDSSTMSETGLMANPSKYKDVVAYKVDDLGTSGKDIAYVYHDAVFTSKRWTYYDPETIVEGDPRYDSRWPGYAFESLGTSREIGQGKLNTQKIMAKDGGAYIQANSNGYPTVMYKIKEMRDALIGGCDDWYLPSDKELEELRKAIGFVKITTSDDPVIVPAGAVTGGVIAGTADGQAHYRDYQTTRTCYPSATSFLSQYLWASSEYSAVHARYWAFNFQYWNNFSKNDAFSVVGVRAF